MVHWVYALERSEEVVFYGTTTDPKTEESTHRGGGKEFDKLTLVEKLRTPEEAQYWKRVYLSSFRKNNSGHSPEYNLTLAS